MTPLEAAYLAMLRSALWGTGADGHSGPAGGHSGSDPEPGEATDATQDSSFLRALMQLADRQKTRALAPVADRMDDRLRGKHWEARVGEAEIELHQYTMIPEGGARQIRLYRSFEQAGLTGELPVLEFDGVAVAVPEETFNAFYLFYHAWRTFLSLLSGGFRQVFKDVSHRR